MVTKIKKGEKKGRVKVGKLKLNKETVKDLTGSQLGKVKGGKGRETYAPCSNPCPMTRLQCPHFTTPAAGC